MARAKAKAKVMVWESVMEMAMARARAKAKVMVWESVMESD
jgi:hypothetical protein